MTDNKPQYYPKALEFAKDSSGPYAKLEYLGEYEEYEVYEIVYQNDFNDSLVNDFILANEDMVFKSYYHESVDIAAKFNK